MSQTICALGCKNPAEARITWVNPVTGPHDSGPLCEPHMHEVWGGLPDLTRETVTILPVHAQGLRGLTVIREKIPHQLLVV